MDSRDRVFLALDFCEPDRVPRDFWGSGGFYSLIKKKRGLTKEAFLDLYDVDLRYIEGPRYIGPPLKPDEKDFSLDIWGVRRRQIRMETTIGGEETYSEVESHPLADARSPEDIDGYQHWPSPEWFDYSPVLDQCRKIRERGRIAVFMGDRLNRIAQLKPAMYLRGMEKLFMDFAVAPDIASAVFDRLCNFYTQYLERILDAADGGIDIVLTGDDFGAQNGLLLSPAMWRRFLACGFRNYIEIIHSFGARCMHHTCGAVSPLVPDMVECGLDILQSLQPEGMSAELPELKAKFRDRLAFQGGISVQKTLPRNTPAQVVQEVRDRIDTLAPGGGYILGTAHNVQADCPLQNVDAMLDAWARFGKYS